MFWTAPVERSSDGAFPSRGLDVLNQRAVRSRSGVALTEPKSEDADELLSDGAPSFWSNPPAPILQIALASNPNEITADERFPIHAIGAVDQDLMLPGQPLGAMALASEDIDCLEVGILTTVRWRDDDTRVLPVREFTIKCVPLLHRSTA